MMFDYVYKCTKFLITPLVDIKDLIKNKYQ